MKPSFPRLSLLGLLVAGCAGAQPVPVDARRETPPCPSVSPVDATKGAEAAPKARHVDAVADDLLRFINAKDSAGVVALLGGPMRDVLPVEKAGPWIAGMLDAKGKLASVAREPGRGSEHSGVYRFKAERGEWQLELHIDKEGTIVGLKFSDPPPPDPEVAKSTLAMGLPFRGQWSVFWGGDRLEVNQHVPHKSQRRAADLVVVDGSGKTHRGDGKRNEDYLAYGQDILTVADGTVVTAIDGVPDSAPGVMNPYFALGNVVIIKHGGAVYSAYAHLQPGKLRVKAGATVKKGAVIGVCGNSGNSSEPHLHFQLQDGALFESSWGVEPIFKDVPVVRDARASKRAEYTWLKGDLVGEPAKR
jgi:murein DD-endopeptidase MepM/ murein hydrolase activator NlpD